MAKDLAKLLLLLVAVAALVLALHYLGTQEDTQNKYQHPITRPGSHW